MTHKWDPVCPEPRGLVRPGRIDPTGATGPTRGQAAGPRWRRTSRGCYVPVDTPTTVPEQRILEQSVRLPAGGVVTGWAAARLHRVGLLDGLAGDGHTPLPVPLALGLHGRIRGDTSIVRLYEALAPADVTSRYGIPCAVIERAVFDALRLAPDVREATVVADMVAAARRTSLTRMRAYVDTHPRCRNIGQARRALALASEHSRSPNETRLRLVWVLDAGLPDPWANCEILDRAGRLLGVADLLDETAGLVAEFDGEDHLERRRHVRDIDKDDAFRRVGLETVRITGTHLRQRRLVVDRLLRGRARARFEPPSRRAWVARPNPLDVQAHLLEQEAMRELHEFWERQAVPDIDEIRRL
ncbi:MAG TPA: hypothetical protein VI452_06120 [Marmoricola sp.]